MFINFVAFNFKSKDLEAEDRNYLGHHVALAKQLPGLRFYYTGRAMAVGGKDPERYRAAILGFDSAEASSAGAKSPVMTDLSADTRAHLTELTSHLITGETIVPFESRKPGQSCFTMVAEFDLEQSGGADAAERHYLGTHTGIARQLPGLRNYMIGKLDPKSAERYRVAILTFDSLDALRDAYRSPIGRDLVRDEEATIRNARVWRLDARIEV
jgi:uncharacterized protein (TIGR02118 family)